MKQNEKIDERIGREGISFNVTDWAQPVSELLIGRLTL
jgi:hypothetical protein